MLHLWRYQVARKGRLRRPPDEHRRSFYADRNNGRKYSNKSQNNRPTILAFDSEHNDKFKVVTFLDLIRLSHFEPSLRPRRQAREGGEKCDESLWSLTTLYFLVKLRNQNTSASRLVLDRHLSHLQLVSAL